MAWYAAHAVLVVRYRSGEQTSLPIWENIYLINAASDDQAFKDAEDAARSSIEDDPSFTWDGHPARWEFVGIRKLITCIVDENGNLFSGCEATYSQLEFRTAAELEAFMKREPSRPLIDE